MRWMKISFVVPAFNAEGTIGRTLDSILRQTDGRYEIIVVNDGSSDNTENICRKYLAENKDRMTYIYQENRGLGGARNRGMELASGEYVSFLDSDDWLMPGYVEKILGQLEGMTDSEMPEMIMTLPVIYHEMSHMVLPWYDSRLFMEIFPSDGVTVNPDEHMEIYQFEVNQCRKVLAMDFVSRTGFRFRERIKWEDVYPHFFLLSQCSRCMGIGSTGFYYRTGGSGQITGLRGKERLDILDVYDDIRNYITDSGRDYLIFPAMRITVRFAVWCIRTSDTDTRKELVYRIHRFFRALPRRWCRVLKKESRKEYSKADALQYRLFAAAIRHRMLCRIFNDGLYQEAGEKLVKKLTGAGERVA